MASQFAFNLRVRECAEQLAAAGVDALGALFDFTSQRLVRFAIALARNQCDAEDAVQTALVRLAREPQLLAAAQSPWAYLLRMVRNEALLIARRNQRSSPAGDMGELITVCRVDAAEQLESQQAVWTAIRRLPTDQAEVVVLKIWEELTFAEIGQILELSPHTAASRYKYAMAKLATQLGKQHHEVQRD